MKKKAKKELTVFEKIYFTLTAFALPTFIIGLCICYVCEAGEIAWIAVSLPLAILFAIFILDFIVCEIVLKGIWKIKFSLFPNIFE